MLGSVDEPVLDLDPSIPRRGHFWVRGTTLRAQFAGEKGAPLGRGTGGRAPGFTRVALEPGWQLGRALV